MTSSRRERQVMSALSKIVVFKRIHVSLKPNSIMLAGSKPVRSWSQTGSKPKSNTLSGSKLVGDRLRTSFEPDSVMEFGREPASSC